MPYIHPADRLRFTDALNALPVPSTPGELNYLLTELAHRYVNANGQDYQSFNDVLGALEGAKLELYRRRIAPYEDQKMLHNGDVWPGDDLRPTQFDISLLDAVVEPFTTVDAAHRLGVPLMRRDLETLIEALKSAGYQDSARRRPYSREVERVWSRP